MSDNMSCCKMNTDKQHCQLSLDTIIPHLRRHLKSESKFTNDQLQNLDRIKPSNTTVRFCLTTHVTKGAVPPRLNFTGVTNYEIGAINDGTVPPLTTKTISAGVYVVPPEGYYMQVEYRTYPLIQKKISVTGFTDTPDRGEVFVIFKNGSSDVSFNYNTGDIIARLVPRIKLDKLKTEYFLVSDMSIE